MKEPIKRILDGTQPHPLDIPTFYWRPILTKMERAAEVLKEHTGLELIQWVGKIRVALRIWNLGIPLRTPGYIASVVTLAGILNVQAPEQPQPFDFNEVHATKDPPPGHDLPDLYFPPRRPENKKGSSKDPTNPPDTTEVL